MTVSAQVHFQHVNSRGDCDFDHESPIFDITPVLDGLALDELPIYADDLHDNGVLNYGDDLYHDAVDLKLVEDWDGPFEFYLMDNDEYQTYLESRLDTSFITPLTLSDKKTILNASIQPERIGSEDEYAFAQLHETFQETLDAFCEADVTSAEEFIDEKLEDMYAADDVVPILQLVRLDMPREKILQAQVWLCRD